MDKLRALEYFLAAIKFGSLSAAARTHGVSVQAAAKAIDALEAHLGTKLFVRSAKGLSLTVDGAHYAEQCEPSVQRLAAADELLKQSRDKPTGTLVVGGTNFVVQQCLVPELPSFHAAFPDLSIDLRSVMHLNEPAAKECDVLVVQGWFDADHWVKRELPSLRNYPVATPAYWAKHGFPAHPSELANHTCLCYRNPYGKLLDVWRFQKDKEAVDVAVKGWMHANHRNHLRDLALMDGGVLRVSAVVEHHFLQNGTLTPALLDWMMLDAAPVALYFEPAQRESPKVRAFVNFAFECITRLAAAYDTSAGATQTRPDWYLSSGHRVSDWLERQTHV